MELWRDTSKPTTVQQSLFEYDTKLALIHNLCQETPTNEHPITCGNAPDIFAEQLYYFLRSCAISIFQTTPKKAETAAE